MAADTNVRSPVGHAAVLQRAGPDDGWDGAGESGVGARFRLADNQIHEFTCPATGSDGKTILTVGVVKGGSTLLHKIVTNLAPHSQRTFVPIDRKFFHHGISINDAVEDIDRLFGRRGYIFGTFRWLPRKLFMPSLVETKKVLLVRDPRDMLVSAYYSFKESHGIPESGPVRQRLEQARSKLADVAIDDYVMAKADGLKRDYLRTMTLLTMGNLLLRRYEDIIFDKHSFVRDLSRFLETDASEIEIAAIAKKHDVIPEREDTSLHIRQVKPRNFVDKLSPSTAEEITYKFRAILCEFGYT